MQTFQRFLEDKYIASTWQKQGVHSDKPETYASYYHVDHVPKAEREKISFLNEVITGIRKIKIEDDTELSKFKQEVLAPLYAMHNKLMDTHGLKGPAHGHLIPPDEKAEKEKKKTTDIKLGAFVSS